MDYFDCHADTLTCVPASESLWENTCNLDLRRVRQFASQYAQIFAIWKDQAEILPGRLEEDFLQIYGRAVQLLEEQAEWVQWCKSARDMQHAHQAKKAAAFLSIEDISIMGTMVGQLRELGICFAMLTWNYENCYACGAVAGQSKGITAQGRELVRKLRQQQVILDISHLSDQGVEDLFQETDAPVMASHSNVRSICSHPRNLQEAHIKELIRRKGLMGINFYGPFVKENPQIEHLLWHIDAVFSMGGEDVLAIGSDFDGCADEFPKGMADVLAVPRLKALMEQAGFGQDMIQKLFFGNAQRFLLQNLPEV